MLSLAATLVGCSDLSPGDIVTPTSPPTVAAEAVFARPVGNPTLGYSTRRALAYEHSGSSLYSEARSELVEPSQIVRRNHTDRPYRSQHDFYTSTVINRELWDIPQDGNWSIRATYVTQNPSRFSEPNGFRSVIRSSPFRICQAGSSGCNPTLGPGDSGNRTLYCGPYGDQCQTGGGSGGTAAQWFQTFRRHTASMGPFFAASNVGSSTSRAEIENLVNSLTPAQRDGIADIVYEAYGESVYEYLAVPTGSRNQDEAIAGGDGSALLAFTAPLAYANRAGMSSAQRSYLDQLLATESAHRSALGMPGKQGDPAEERAASTRTAMAWPNPATEAVHLRVSAAAVGPALVFDARGRLVAQLRFQDAETEQTITWDLRSAAGGRVPAGMYRIVVPARDGSRAVASVVVL